MTGLDFDLRIARSQFDVVVDLSIEPGERFVFFGPSGAGKTTILESIAGLVRIEEGLVELNGRVLTNAGPPYRSLPLALRRVGLLRQDPALFPHLNVARNIAFSRQLSPDSPEVTRIASELGLDGTLASLPGTLSGGQRQRVALARVLLSDYSALLLDEPYAGLDVPLRRELTSLAVELGASVPSILVTHELETAQAFAHRIGVLDLGRLLQIGDSLEVVSRPVSRRVAELVGYLSFIEISGKTVGVHPDKVVDGNDPGRGVEFSGTVASSKPAGVFFEIALDVDTGTVNSAAPATAVRAGQRIVFNLRDNHPVGDPLVVKVLDAPIFGSRGAGE